MPNTLYDLYKNARFNVDILGQDATKITYIFNGVKYKATYLLEMFKGK